MENQINNNTLDFYFEKDEESGIITINYFLPTIFENNEDSVINALIDIIYGMENNIPYSYQNEYSLIETESLQEDQQLVRNDEVKIKVEIESYKDDSKHHECSICLETFNLDEKIAQIKCNHLFHLNCIQEWGYYKTNCPVCKTDIDLI